MSFLIPPLKLKFMIRVRLLIHYHYQQLWICYNHISVLMSLTNSYLTICEYSLTHGRASHISAHGALLIIEVMAISAGGGCTQINTICHYPQDGMFSTVEHWDFDLIKDLDMVNVWKICLYSLNDAARQFCLSINSQMATKWNTNHRGALAY